MSSDRQVRQLTIALPTGTVTFLFTDIEGSTQRWEQHREAMEAAVTRHDQVISEAVSRYGGFVFKTVGDAFCVAFPTVSQAIGAALDAQAALSKEDFSAVGGLYVRMALHTGHAQERNADYFGPAVNRVARLMSIGHGGQVLMSQAAYELGHTELPVGASLIDLGLIRLKDLSEPEHVWQLSTAEVPADFPPLKSLDELPNNLPIQPTSFEGRESDLQETKKLLAERRVLTLIGSGGIGKTRLAVQVGAESLDQFPDGVWFADISTITDPELVSSVVASALGIEQVQGKRVDELIPQRLKRKRLLLIIDNCEHLLGAVAMLVDAIQRNAPDVRMLCTSRQALGIAGEIAHRLSSLAVPEAGSAVTADEAIHYGSITVFVDRARSADTRFALTNDNAPIVAEICRHLDGIPLAIELAAARVKVLSIPNLAQRLNERFKLLTSGSRTALPRQQTLSALIDWSYDLLTPQEQALFRRVAIFAGGFSLDAAVAVCDGDAVDGIDIFDLLASLTDKSLVLADTAGSQERYHLLESTRAYGLDKLGLAGERDRLARRHAEFFRDQAVEVDKLYGIGSTEARLRRLETELDNYRAALEWALTDGHDVVLAGILTGSLQELWKRGGLNAEGRYWTERAQRGLDEGAHPQVAARLWHVLAALASGKVAHDYLEHAIALYRSTGDEDDEAWALSGFGHSLYQMGRRQDAQEAIDRALEIMRNRGDKAGIAHCLNVRAYCTTDPDDPLEMRKRYNQALEAFKALGDEYGVALALGNLAELEFGQGQVDLALRYVKEAVDRRPSPSALNNLAAYRVAEGDLDGAGEAARAALYGAQKAADRFDIAVAVQHLGLLAALRGKRQVAARLVGYTDAQYEDLEQERETTEAWGYAKIDAALREHMSDAEMKSLAAEGAAWSEDQVVEEALKIW